MVPFMTVDYNEGELDNLDYRGIVLKLGEKEVLRAKTGDFVNDYNAVIHFFRENYQESGLPLMQSSSIEHYISDAGLQIIWDED